MTSSRPVRPSSNSAVTSSAGRSVGVSRGVKSSNAMSELPIRMGLGVLVQMSRNLSCIVGVIAGTLSS